jgi:hypothetical protein
MDAPQIGQASRSFEPKFSPFSTRTGAVLALAEFDYRRFIIVARHAFKRAPILAIFIVGSMRAINIGTPQTGHRRSPIGGGEDGSNGALPYWNRRERDDLSVTDSCGQSRGR